jgi:hypothetical protein
MWLFSWVRSVRGGPVQEHGQEPAADREADALGLGRTREGGAAVVVQVDRAGEPVLELGDATTEGGDLLTELLEL